MGKKLRLKRLNQTFIVTDYWDEIHSHRPYMGMLHGDDDKPVRASEVLEQAMKVADAKDGDEVIVLVLKTGRRPFGARRTRFVRPNQYERETEEDVKRRRKSAK
jgi:hypothetical protein